MENRLPDTGPVRVAFAGATGNCNDSAFYVFKAFLEAIHGLFGEREFLLDFDLFHDLKNF